MLQGINSVSTHGINGTVSHGKTEKISQQTNFTQQALSSKASDAIKMNNFSLSRAISFGAALAKSIEDHTRDMETCGKEFVGTVTDVTGVLFDTQTDRRMIGDAAKSTTKIGERYIRSQAKATGEDTFKKTQDSLFEMTVRGDDAKSYDERSKDVVQDIKIELTPVNKHGQGTKEQIFVVNTKGNTGDNFVTVIQDENDVLMTNAGSIEKKDSQEGKLKIVAQQDKNVFRPFSTKVGPIQFYKPTPSVGEGTEIVIGMENGRFTNEIMHSIQQFVDKIEREEIVLKPFVAAPNAKETQLIMLAGGFGSRAEYANATSDGILHGNKDGAISTKGIFQTVTGLTPMETTFVTLHNAGLLDCSKGKIGIDKNIKFYLNKGQNRGNGEFSADLYMQMQRTGRKRAMIFPNDSMSRMTDAVIAANDKMISDNAAIVMIAKKVKAQDCINTFGIMKLAPDGEIIEFAEKPAQIPEGYADSDNMCLTNTFQFAVSDEAFRVLDMFEDLFIPEIDKKTGQGKESRDWSKQYVPIIKTLTQDSDIETIRKNLAKALNNKPEYISDEIINKAKSILGNQKIYAVPTDEPWADCGTLNALYDTSMKIANGDFVLEDFERKRALDCVNTHTGLVASSPEQKERIEDKYEISGQIMVAPCALKVNDEDVEHIPVTVHVDNAA